MWDDGHQLQNEQLTSALIQPCLLLYLYEGSRQLMHILVWDTQESCMIILRQQADMNGVFIWLDPVILWLLQ